MENTTNTQPTRTDNTSVAVEEEKGLTLRDIFHVIRKHWIVMLSMLVVGTGAGFAAGKITNKVAPQYTASATMMVTVSAESLGTGTATAQYQLSNYLTKTFVAFVKEDAVIDNVASKYEVKTSSIQKALAVSLKDETLILSVKYTNADKQKAVDITNDIAKYTILTADSLIDDTELPSKENAKYPLLYKSISLVTGADIKKVTVASKTTTYTLIGAAVGLVGAVVYAVLREMFDNTFKSNNDIEKELGIPVLADIPVYEIEIKDVKEKEGK